MKNSIIPIVLALIGMAISIEIIGSEPQKRIEMDSPAKSYKTTFVIPKAHLDTTCLAFNPEGTKLASGGLNVKSVKGKSGEGYIKIWEVSSGKLSALLKGHRGSVEKLAFTDSNTIISIGEDFEVKLWDLDAGKEKSGYSIKKYDNLLEYDGFRTSLTAVSLSPDGKFIALGLCTAGSCGDACYCDNAEVGIIDALTGAEIDIVKVDSNFIDRIFVGLNNKFFALSACSFYKYADDKKYGIVPVGCFTSDVGIYNSQGESSVNAISFENNDVSFFSFDPQGAGLIIQTTDGKSMLFDAVTRKMIETMEGRSSMINAAVFASDEHVIIGGDKGLSIWDLKMNKVYPLDAVHGVKTISCNRNSNAMAAGYKDGKIKIWLSSNR